MAPYERTPGGEGGLKRGVARSWGKRAGAKRRGLTHAASRAKPTGLQGETRTQETNDQGEGRRRRWGCSKGGYSQTSERMLQMNGR